MKKLQIYDPPMCCSTGICGPDVDTKLVRFAADLKWLGERGVAVERFNLAQTPVAFVEKQTVRDALEARGEGALPLVLVDGEVVSTGSFPSREDLAGWLGLADGPPSLFSPAVAELVAIGAAIAANCESCLRHHVRVALGLGVSRADVDRAVALAAKVKDVPHRAILRLASRLTQDDGGGAVPQVAEVAAGCCAAPAPGETICCG